MLRQLEVCGMFFIAFGIVIVAIVLWPLVS